MADNVAVTAGTGTTIAADEVVDATLGTVKVQYVKIMDGTLDGTSKAAVGATGVAVNTSGIGGTAIATGSGAMSAGVQRVALATDSPGVITTGTAGSPSSVVLSVQGVTSGTPVTISEVPTTSGGLTVNSFLIASGTNANPVKASAGQLYKVEITNNSANIAYLKLYNTAGTPTAGSGTPLIRLMVPGNASGTGIISSYDLGVAFSTGIGFTFTGGIADADTTSVAASAFIVNLYYK